MAIEDIRLKLDVLEHPKMRELHDIFDEMAPNLGAVAFQSWLRLVIHAARNCQDGVLRMTQRRLASTARWPGEPAQFSGVLIEVGLLEQVEGGFELHDWSDHQAYVAATAVRVARAKKAAAARWKGEELPGDASSIPIASYKNAPTLTNTLTKTLTNTKARSSTSSGQAYSGHTPSITRSVTAEPRELITWFNEHCCPPLKPVQNIGMVPLASVDGALRFLREMKGPEIDEVKEMRAFFRLAVQTYEKSESIPCNWGLMNICKEQNMHKIFGGLLLPKDDAADWAARMKAKGAANAHH